MRSPACTTPENKITLCSFSKNRCAVPELGGDWCAHIQRGSLSLDSCCPTWRCTQPAPRPTKQMPPCCCPPGTGLRLTQLAALQAVTSPVSAQTTRRPITPDHTCPQHYRPAGLLFTSILLPVIPRRRLRSLKPVPLAYTLVQGPQLAARLFHYIISGRHKTSRGSWPKPGTT